MRVITLFISVILVFSICSQIGIDSQTEITSYQGKYYQLPAISDCEIDHDIDHLTVISAHGVVSMNSKSTGKVLIKASTVRLGNGFSAIGDGVRIISK